MNQLLLAAVMFLGLIMIPFGLPGTWIIAAAALGYQLLVPGTISMFTIVVVFGLAVIGEVLEFSLSAKYTRKYGGSRRASWGAIIGGMIGAFVGVPVPIVGMRYETPPAISTGRPTPHIRSTPASVLRNK